MHKEQKIYSRYRIRLPKINNNRFVNNYNKKGKFFRVFVILFIAFFGCKFILDIIFPIFDELCENKAKSVATIIANEQATEVMKKYQYEDLFDIEKDSQGNVSMIKANVISINEISSDVANRIQDTINSREREKIEIALGSFTGLKLLAGKGPGIKISISSIGDVETNLRSEFTSQGINQTLHRIYLEVKANVSILTPFDKISKEITNQILLMENVIIGNVPDTFYNLEGINNTENALETIE